MNKLQETLRTNEKLIGSVASVLAIIMFFSLIEILISNLGGQSSIFIQPFATSINGVFWSMYAYGRKDYFLLIPNILAFILGTLTTIAAFI